MSIEELRKRKKALKITTAGLACMVELPVSTVSKIMTGETKNPSYTTIELIDTALSKLEQQKRVSAFVEEYGKYLRENPDFSGSSLEFEPIYREKNNLTDAPIPFAVPRREKESEGNLALNTGKGITISEYLKLSTDEYTELINGKLIFAQFPGMRHQQVVRALGFYLQTVIKENNGKCRVYSVGFNLQLDEFDNTLLGPDIIVCCDRLQENELGLIGAPDWIIEVTSPSTRRKDYREKLAKYLEAGVREYWIIDLQKDIVTVYLGGEPTLSYLYQFSDDIPVGIYDGKLSVNLDKLIGVNA